MVFTLGPALLCVSKQADFRKSTLVLNSVVCCVVRVCWFTQEDRHMYSGPVLVDQGFVLCFLALVCDCKFADLVEYKKKSLFLFLKKN